MRKSRRFRPPYPDTMEVFETEVEPAGPYFRDPRVAKFARTKEPSLKLKREPKDPHDPNAIRVIGCGRGFLLPKRYFLGYLPRAVAKRIVQGGFSDKVQARLRVLEADEDMRVEFDILGPRGQKEVYWATL